MRKALPILLLILLPYPALAQVQTTVSAAPPSPSANDPNAIYCRPPQQLPGQRLYGPKVCKPQHEWDDLHRQGLDLGADGESVVASEKFRTFHGCNSGAAC
jgi:hypothetical protein